ANNLFPGDTNNLADVFVSSPPVDSDGDGLPDSWENQFGLSERDATGLQGANGDPDNDGLTNRQELERGTHPRGVGKRYLAEGASGPFFDTRIALLNPSATVTETAVVEFLKTDGTMVSTVVSLPPYARRTVFADAIAGLASAEFSIVVEAESSVVVDRTMT